jgi:hypothetical protein
LPVRPFQPCKPLDQLCAILLRLQPSAGRRRIPALRSNRRGRASDSKRSSKLSARLASGRRRNSAAVPENSGGAGGVLAASGARSVD